MATAADYFGSMVESYDSLIRRAVPRYDEMIDRLIDYLPSRVENVLELGSGTGNFSLRLVDRFPSARLTFVDASAEMLEVTRSRVVSRSGENLDRCTFIRGYFEELDLAGSFDLVTSTISLHHVRDKASHYRRVASLLEPGGSFRFADQLRGGTDELHEKNWHRWLEFCRLPGNCTPEEVTSLLDHAAAHDHYTPLLDHFEMLREAGFTSLDCVWRNWIWGIVVADRS